MKFRVALAAAALAPALLGGCATLAPVAVDRELAEKNWAKRRTQIEAIHQFQLQGRMASGVLGIRADFVWQQNSDGSFDLHLSGPFGAGAMSLRGDEHQVEVTTREGSQLTGNPEFWLQQRLGWTLPINGLRWWALGLPSPLSEAQLQFNADGQAIEIQQNGWTLSYGEYAGAGPYQLPKKFEADNGEVKIKVLADEWSGL